MKKILILKKRTSRRYPAETITGANNTYYLTLLANVPAPTECQLHSLKQAAAGIGLCANSNKAALICFQQDDAIST